MLGNDYFYNESIRNFVTVFGKLFSDIQIKKEKSDGTSELIKVPIHYANKSKLYHAIFQNDSGHISLPRMGFDFIINGVDEERKTSRLNTKLWKHDNNGTATWSYNAIPYDFDFTLSIFTNDIEDGLQIVEQILPYFQPSLTVKIKPFANYDEVVDINIILNSVQNDFNTDGQYNENDYYSWDLSFTVKGWLFAQEVNENNLILDISKVSVWDWDSFNDGTPDYGEKV